MTKNRYLSGKRIVNSPIPPNVKVVDLVDNYFQAFNAGRLHDACRLFVGKILANDVTVGISLTGALTPAGLGGTCIVPLIKAGFVDWIVSTGANLYHDTHFGIGLNLYKGSPFFDDIRLRKNEIIRIYDIVFDYKVLFSTDAFYRKVLRSSVFQKEMSTAEFHYILGKFVYEREKVLKIPHNSILSNAYLYKVPIYTSSPGDSSIGMNVAALAFHGCKLKFDVNKDVNETTAIVLDAKLKKGKSAVVIFGGGSPKNFILQTEPQIQEVLHIDEKGHDYFLQITDARPDTGGLSGATPGEAVSWGKLDPNKLPDAVVCYSDSSIAMPIITSYALSVKKKRAHKKLYLRLENMISQLESIHKKFIRNVKNW
jgi:deoxyhypusine synthase